MPTTRWTVLILAIAHCLNSAPQPKVPEPRTSIEEGGKQASTSANRHFNQTTNPPTNSPPLQRLSDLVPYFETVQLIVRPISPNRKVDMGISVEFHAFNRTFSMNLHRATDIDSAIVLPTTKVVSFSSTGKRTQTIEDLGVTVLVGFETDCPECSRIYGTMYRDDLEFALHSPTESYFVEPISKYPQLNRTGKHLAVVYRRSDIRFTSNDSQPEDLSGKYGKIPSEGYFRKRTRSRRHILADPAQSCKLMIVADHTFFETIAQRSKEQAVAEMINHVATADFVFRMTDFDGDSVGDNIGFSIEAINVFQDANAPGYALRRVDTGDQDTLLAFAMYNFADFCAAILFTFRDLGATLGISYTPVNGEVHNGICAQPSAIDQSGVPGASITLNAILVTQLSGGSVVPRTVLSLVVTHELGHSFGAEHDDNFCNLACNPNASPLGNYIMHSSRDLYDSLLSKNDWTFSPCAIYLMEKIIDARDDFCFTTQPFPICGNLILDHGEQCDCGNIYSCAVIDPCCRPPSMSTVRENNGCTYATENGCQCSPRWDRCCSDLGLIRPASDAFVCRIATDCTKASVCDGSSASCPAPKLVTDETACGGGEGKCRRGVCSRSVCTRNGLADCTCQWPESAKCKVCCGCTISGDEISCLPAEWLALSVGAGGDQLQTPIYQLPGTECDGGRGKCSNDAVCVR